MSTVDKWLVTVWLVALGIMIIAGVVFTCRIIVEQLGTPWMIGFLALYGGLNVRAIYWIGQAEDAEIERGYRR